MLLDLALGEHQRVPGPALELKLDKARPGVGGDGGEEGQGGKHRIASQSTPGRRPRTSGQAAGVVDQRATRAPNFCNFNSIPS